MQRKLSTAADQALRAAGWYPGRDISSLVADWFAHLCDSSMFAAFPEARRVLSEFGDITVTSLFAGVDYAPGKIVLDPVLALGEQDRFESFEDDAGSRLFPLGEIYGGHAFLAIGESGRLFMVGDDLTLLGDSFEEGISNLIEGRRFSK